VVESTEGRLVWLEALVEVSQQLLSMTEGAAPVAQRIIEHVHQLSRARTVTFVGPSRVNEAHFEVRLATGAGAEHLIGTSYDKARTLEGRALQENRGFLSTAQSHYSHHVDAATEEPAGPLLVVPFDGSEGEQGAIVASRAANEALFSSAELAMAEAFARQCSIALQLADVQASREQLRFRQQRDAETRLLHDDLIQQLFSLGVTLDLLRTTAATPPQPQGLELWHQATGLIDAVISQLRSTLTSTPELEPDS
jgi:nitrate/nitrite-specific signal transduction histidine kinase